MWRTFSALICSTIALLLSSEAYGCSSEPVQNWRDMPINILADGSFRGAEEESSYGMGGMAPVEIGNGKVGQRIFYSSLCSISERLLVVDCNSLEGIVIDGVLDEYGERAHGGFPPVSVDMLYPPRGKIRLTKSVTISDLAAVSLAEGYDFTTDLQAAFATKKKKNRYNPFNGCKIFYPDSPGAKAK